MQSAPANIAIGHPDHRSVCWAAALVVATAIVVFSPSLRNDYTHDDLWALRDNTYYQENQLLWNLFNHNYFRMSAETTYRPMVTASYALDHALWTRARPADSTDWTAAQYKRFAQENLVRWRFGMHVHNLLLHAINALLVFTLVLRLWNGKAAFITAMLFAIHPVQAEVVNAVGYREDLQATFFVLLGAYAFLTWRSRAAAPVAALCYALALLAKESAGLMPAALFAVERIMGREESSIRKTLRSYSGFALVALLYLVVRFGLMLNPTESGVPYPGGSFRTALLTMWPNLMREFRLILLPTGLSVHYDIVPSQSLFAPEVLFAITYLAALGVALVALRRRQPLLVAGFAWYFLMLLPTCNLLPIPGILNDRYLYLPILGLFVPAGIGVSVAWENGTPRRRWVIAFAFALLFGAYAAQSMARTLDWRDQRALSLSTLRTNNRSLPSWINYSNDCAERGNLEEARKSMEYVTRLRPDSAPPYAQLGQVLEKLGKPAEAEAAYRDALARDPDDLVALNSLGVLCIKQRRYAEAVPCIQRVVRVQRQPIPEVLVNLATALSFTGARDKAEALLNGAVRECPYSEAVHNALGNIYYRTGRYESALREHLCALELSPGHPVMLGNVGADLIALERDAEAIPYLRRALQEAPGAVSTRARLANCLIRTGKVSEGRALLQEMPNPASGAPGR